MPLDWDKLRIFNAAAEAGSFTHAGEKLGLSQSAVSRQVSTLEHELNVPLFHRHARGLILTEPGELLLRTTRDVFAKLEATRASLSDSRERPHGELKVTTTVGLGSAWLPARLGEFFDLYPDIRIQLLLADDELDLAMREADVAIRLRQPTQPDLIQRRLFTVHFHVYAAPEYIARHGEPETIADLDKHRILGFGGNIPAYLANINWLATVERDERDPRPTSLTMNSVVGLKRAVERGVGMAVLPDYLIERSSPLVQVLVHCQMPHLDAYFVYPEELRNVARIQVFRDFLLTKAQRWAY